MQRCVYIIGGTTEANRAADRLGAEGCRVVVSVATEMGARLSRAASTEAGPKDAAAIAAAVNAAGADAILDCSHPYAVHATCESKQAAAFAKIPYLRYTRAPDAAPGMESGALRTDRFSSWEAAAACLRKSGGPALLTIGSRNLPLFVETGVDITARVLPEPETLAACAAAGVGPESIIAAHPPFSVDFNRACLRRARARVMVTKDSGAAGGLPEKLEAAAAEGVRVLMIIRPPEPEEAVYDLDEVVGRLWEVTAS